MVRWFARILRNSNGVSLTEVMIGGGILAGIALAGAQLFKNQKFSQMRIEHDQKLATYHMQLSKMMNLSENCNATMKLVLTNGSGIPAGLNIPSIKKCTSGCTDANSTADLGYDAWTPGAYTSAVGADYVTSSATKPATGSTAWIDNTESWWVKSIETTQAVTRNGTVTLRVTYEMNPRKYSKQISKDITFNARFINGSWRECRSKLEGSVNNLQNDLCKSFNLQEINSTGNIARWDEASQTCVFDSGKACPTNFTLDGIDSNGMMRCRPVIKSNDINDLKNTTTTSCGVGQRPTMRFNTATRKMEIQCL